MSDEKVREDIWRHDIGLGWLFRVEYSETWLDFKAYEVVANDITDINGKKYPPEFHLLGATSGMDTTPDPDKADVSLDGFVKWDGCCEVTLGTERQPHFCGLGSMRDFHKAMQAVFFIAATKLKSADEDMILGGLSE